MQYYNENPQVTYWREKYEDMKARNEMLLKSAEGYRNYSEKELGYMARENIRLIGKITEYNLLPWYKRIFKKI